MTVHVVDASRAVGVATSLLSKEQEAGFVANVRTDYAALREQHAGRAGQRTLRSLDEAAVYEHSPALCVAREVSKNQSVRARVIGVWHPGRVLEVRQPVHRRGERLQASCFLKGTRSFGLSRGVTQVTLIGGYRSFVAFQLASAPDAACG